MTQHYIRRGVFISLLGGMFILGFVSGSVRQRSAQAQVPGMGGALDSVKELGSSVVEMQQHVDGLQKNIATLKKVQAALGGGK
jgi:acyl CoA:acetate/3-ketoacid CoA transferase beta subunit